MNRIDIKNVFKLIKSSMTELEEYTIEVFSDGEELEDFHQWADYKSIVGGFKIINQRNETYNILLIDWREENNYYFVIFSKNRAMVIAELHELVEIKDEDYLFWRYKPTKQDGRNDERKKIFSKYMQTVEVLIKIPQNTEELEQFFDELFLVCRNRVIADKLINVTDEANYYSEGKTYLSLHTSFERNAALIKGAKNLAININGKLQCEICNFDFFEVYGELGKDFIEAHHKVPLSEMRKAVTNTVQDIALICSNCHSMIHRRKSWLRIDELRNIVNQNIDNA
jgi:predicted HNH restriction endonuclease